MSEHLLPKSGFLAGASPGLLDLLERVSNEINVDAGEVLIHQGDDGDALYAVVSGLLEVSVLSEDGRRLALDMMRPGALFGEIALFDPGIRTASVRAIENTRLRRVKNADVMEAVRKAPELAVDLISLAGQRMRWMNSQLHEQVFLPMPARLARKILYLTIDGKTTRNSLTLSQAELAEYVGATREAVSKTFATWKKNGVITSSRGGMKVLDRAALTAIANPYLM